VDGHIDWDDDELVERAKDGDVSAFEELIRHYQQLAARVAYVVVRNEADAADAAQEAFVKAYYALGRFKPGAPFRPWLLKIVTNEARSRRRSVARRDSLAHRVAEQSPSGDAAPSPETAAFIGEQRREVISAIDTLSEKDRLVITYRYFLDMSEAEMAEALGIARGTVKSRLARAQERLRARLPREMLDG
jgi:RNA polymerase sigma-70 factor (ECF subfamily)